MARRHSSIKRSRARIVGTTAVIAVAALTWAPARAAAHLAAHHVRAETASAIAASASRGPTKARRKGVKRAAPARLPAYATPRSADALASDIAAMLNARVRGGRWGALVVSLTRGDTLFAHNADDRMQPASTLKLFTTGLALDRFGPDHQLTTDVLRDGTVLPDGTLGGNLYLRGGGDPSLSLRFYGDTISPMDHLARAIAAAGIRHVRGDLVADASAFDDQAIPDGWKRRYLSAAYAAPVSALSLNENVLWIAVEPGRNGASVALQPATTSFTVVNRVTQRGGTGGAVTVRRRGDNELDVSGWIGTHSGPRKYSIVVNDPPRFAAGALRASLAAAGITVDGAIREGITPSGATVVASNQSPPLARIVSDMNRESINHLAELLFRDAARASSPTHTGSALTGETALHQFLEQKVGVPPSAVTVSDGSGLSVRDSVTARALVDLLSYANRAPWSSAFHASLPVAGESELLRKRMKRTPAQGNLHAKTGTTNTVAALSGYVTAEDGEILAFAFIYNGADRWNAKDAMDRAGATLASFSRN